MPTHQTLLRYKVHHLLFWILFGGIWYYLRYQDYRTTEQALVITLVKVVDLMVLVYIANYLLIPRLLYQKKYLLFLVLLIAMIAASSALKMYVIGSILRNPALYQWTSQIKARIYDNVIPHIFLVIAGMAAKLLSDYYVMQNRLLEIAKEKAETELAFLKSQINPHFLFNSLNAVYFLIDKNNTEARQALHTFSGMLRHQLYGVKEEKISIEKEISYLQDYIGLQQLRRENCRVQVDIAPSVKGFAIEPFLLLPFVENSFKHLSHFENDRSNEIILSLSRQDGEMAFAIRNTREDKKTKEEDGGIGLANVQRRLALLYPKKHALQISEEDGWYAVHLTLKL
jgi:sensor histidine kinase YesM